MNMSSIPFRTRLTLVAGSSVFLGLVASAIVAIFGINRLSQDSSRVVGEGLEAASREYLDTYIGEATRQAGFLVGRVASELKTAADATQNFIDHEEDLAFLEGKIGDLPLFDDKLQLHESNKARQNRPPEPCAASSWGPMLDEKRWLKPEALALLRRSAALEPTLLAVHRNGAEKLQTYYIGPEEVTALRLCPWVDIAGVMNRLYPGSLDNQFWKFFFPGLVESWQQWANSPETLRALPDQVTVTAPYNDAGGGGLIITLFHPLWRRDRRTFAGAIGIDITLKQLHTYVEHVHIAQSGFAFLTQQNTNVLAVNAKGEKILGIKAKSTGSAGVDIIDRKIAASTEPTIAALKLPTDDAPRHYSAESNGVPYLIVLRRLPPLQVWSGAVGISPETWTLGFAVPKSEVYATLSASQLALKKRARSIIVSQLSIAGLTLLVLLFALGLMSRRLTRDLVALTDAASHVMKKDYAVKVQPRRDDEIGQLGRAFNAMVAEIRAHTTDLEQRVAARTAELNLAYNEISVLNNRLKAENLRMGAELDVARQVQTMVLPNQSELEAISEFEVVGHMQPATEVGGDYYDVLRTQSGVRIGIGDVTGHGLTSGVLMLMIQTAIRTMLAADEQDLKRTLAVVNKAIYQNVKRIGTGHSATLALLNYHQGRLTITGQHEELILARNSGQLELVPTLDLGMPVGLESDIQPLLAELQIEFAPGDVAVLYTDGVTEAENLKSEQYGMERLCEVVRKHHGSAAHAIKNAILEDLQRFIGEQQVLDDITLLVMKRN